FDLALGNTKALINEFWVDTSDPEGWYVKIRGDYPSWSYNKKDTYYQYMFQDPQFVALLKEIWTTVKPRLDKIPAYIDKMFEYNRLAFNHNDSAGKAPYIGWRGGDDYNITSYSTHDEAVQAMKTFYTRRLAWLDDAIGAL
ncbi:MAG: hypothetical protein IJ255_04725, partial [Bacteroidales bacterium]|nr:hypothetical protein [Bacteroidales bacterium]